MKIFVGLGNPGKKYQNNRHNVGFMAIDYIAAAWGIEVTKNQFSGLYGEGFVGTEKVALLKPQTYMNLSGQSVRSCADYFGVDDEDIVVLYDDMDIACGTMRIRAQGSAGGHNGMKSIISHLGTQAFPRFRIGIDRPINQSVVDYVLDDFYKVQMELITELLPEVERAATMFVKEDIVKVMNDFNKKV